MSFGAEQPRKICGPARSILIKGLQRSSAPSLSFGIGLFQLETLLSRLAHAHRAMRLRLVQLPETQGLRASGVVREASPQEEPSGDRNSYFYPPTYQFWWALSHEIERY